MREQIRVYAPATREALDLLGAQIRLARKARHMTERDLAARIGIARSTVQLIEKGNPKVEIGLMFEAAALTGVPLFDSDPRNLASRLSQIKDKLALLPHSIRRSRLEIKDDF